MEGWAVGKREAKEKKMGKGWAKKLDEATELAIADEFRSGMKAVEIARLRGVSHYLVTSALAKSGLLASDSPATTLKGPVKVDETAVKRYYAVHSIEQTAEHFGISYHRTRKIVGDQVRPRGRAVGKSHLRVTSSYRFCHRIRFSRRCTIGQAQEMDRRTSSSIDSSWRSTWVGHSCEARPFTTLMGIAVTTVSRTFNSGRAIMVLVSLSGVVIAGPSI